MRSDDLISRQEAIAKFEPWLKVEGYSEGELNMLKAVLYELTVMPSAEPEPCDFCVYNMDCGDMRLYCPARGRKE